MSPRAGIHATALVNKGFKENNKARRNEIPSFIPVFLRKKKSAITVRI